MSKYLKKIVTNIGYAAIILYAWMLKKQKKKNIEESENKRILVIVSGAIGDFILFSKILNDLYLQLTLREKVVVEFAMAPSVIPLFDLCTNGRITERYALPILMPNGKTLKGFRQACKLIKGRHYDMVLVTDYNTIVAVFLTTIDSGRTIITQSNETARSPIKRYYKATAATEFLTFPPDKWLPDRYGVLMEYLFHKPYHTALSCFSIEREKKSKSSGAYCVISPGAGEGRATGSYKRWESEKFAAVADHIQEKWNMNVVFTGTKDEAEISKSVIGLMRCHNNYSDVTGRTTIDEWIDVVRQATFVIGNDSGIIHLASALNVPSVCVGGYWEYGKFFPYFEVDCYSQTYLPQYIVSCNVPLCKGCLFSEKKWSANRKCENEVKKGNPCLCLQEVGVDTVIKAIDAIFRMQQENLL